MGEEYRVIGEGGENGSVGIDGRSKDGTTVESVTDLIQTIEDRRFVSKSSLCSHVADFAVGTTLRSRSLEYQSDLLQKFSKEAMPQLFARASGGKGLDIVIHKVYDWSEIVAAHEEMEAARNTGKIICTINWD